MTSYFKKLRNQMRRSVRSQIFVGFPASLSLLVLICSFGGFVHIDLLLMHTIWGGEKKGQEGIIHVLKESVICCTEQ